MFRPLLGGRLGHRNFNPSYLLDKIVIVCGRRFIVSQLVGPIVKVVDKEVGSNKNYICYFKIKLLIGYDE
jgi:hypothetical protein